MAELEIEMKAKRGLLESEKITPLMEPLASCLHYSCLSTHCSACFRLLDSNMSDHKIGFVRYCSSQCEAVDSPIYLSSGEHELFLILESKPHLWPFTHPFCQDVSYLCLALRLLLLLPPQPPPPSGPLIYRKSGPYLPFPHRSLGLSWNNPAEFVFSEKGAFLMARARAMRSDTPFYGPENLDLDINVFTLVITNALRVSLDSPNPIGVALYDYRISWINHSCAPNSYVSFVDAFQAMADKDEDIELPIEPESPMVLSM